MIRLSNSGGNMVINFQKLVMGFKIILSLGVFVISLGIVTKCDIATAQTRNADFDLMVEVNRARINNSIQHSLIFNEDLYQQAFTLIQNHEAFSCYTAHTSCQGERFGIRSRRFLQGVYGAGEIATFDGEPDGFVLTWLNSPNHRAIMLGGFVEYGGAMGHPIIGSGFLKEGDVDFATLLLYPDGFPRIIGALNNDGTARMIYDAADPPIAAWVMIGTKTYTLRATEGTASYGMYTVPISVPTTCEKVVFTAVTGSHQMLTFPPEDWPIYSGPYCADTPPMLDKVNIVVNKTSARFTLTSIPGLDAGQLIISYNNNFLTTPLAGMIKHSPTRTEIKGSIKFPSGTNPVGPGRVRVYLDNELVASMYPSRISATTMTVKR